MIARRWTIFLMSVGATLAVSRSYSQDVETRTSRGDIPAHWDVPASLRNYEVRDVMIPMRDGVKLHTVIAIPKSARHLPMLLERTPYDVSNFVDLDALQLRDAVWGSYRDWVDDGYILVGQDIRGKNGSKGRFIMSRPPIGPLNGTETDETTDAYDTVEWLTKNVPESNARVGLIGSSYDGWTVAMALLHPHPAVRVAAPLSPMVDGWMGDDWFYNGALRQVNIDYIPQQTSKPGNGSAIPRGTYDDYQMFLDAGSAGDFAKLHGIDRLPFWSRLSSHPSYDSFWQSQAVDRLVAKSPSRVPTIWLQGFWDQEDIYGAVHSWEALQNTTARDTNYLVIGPWWHSQVNSNGEKTGPFRWNGDVSRDFRRERLIPFFGAYLKDQPLPAPMPRALIYDASKKAWDSYASWPPVQAAALTPLYLQAGHGLADTAPAGGEDSYMSDPSKPIPFEPLPIRFSDHATWSTWLIQDQRFVSTRPDVLSYQTPILTAPLRLEGDPEADIFARTTGSDLDLVVKVIDVFPPTVAEQPELGGYQLPISLDIFRGRYRHGFDQPVPVPAGQIQEYRFRLPPVNYTIKPGHRLMVQIQSTLFPLYDRNPQNYVKSIFYAKPSDYASQTIFIEHGPLGQSAVRLPVVSEAAQAETAR